MEERVYKCTIVTPMFIAGANGRAAELRAPSLKGVLRYWWRAMNGHLCISKLNDKEGKLFGNSRENNQTKSKILIRLIANQNLIISKKNFPQYNVSTTVRGRNIQFNILNYLAFGIYDFRNGLIRNYYQPNGSFQIKITYDNGLNQNDIEEIEKALYLSSLIGGLGSKTRNGFGKFFIENFSYTNDNIKNLISNNAVLSDYTSFSKETKIFKLNDSFDKWHKALQELGEIYYEVRTSLEKKHEFKKRELIGAPIMDNRRQVSFIDRHAKPVFLSVVKNADKYDGYIFLIPYSYSNYSKRINDYKSVINELKEKFAKKMTVIL